MALAKTFAKTFVKTFHTGHPMVFGEDSVGIMSVGIT
jgi:hypothetical protein